MNKMTRYNELCKQRRGFAFPICTNSIYSILSFLMYILSKMFISCTSKRRGNMDEKKKNEELIKFKKQWFNEDINQ